MVLCSKCHCWLLWAVSVRSDKVVALKVKNTIQYLFFVCNRKTFVFKEGVLVIPGPDKETFLILLICCGQNCYSTEKLRMRSNTVINAFVINCWKFHFSTSLTNHCNTTLNYSMYKSEKTTLVFLSETLNWGRLDSHIIKT